MSERYIVCTYEVVTEESAECGDFAEHGWECPGGYQYPVRDEDGEHPENIGIDHKLIGWLVEDEPESEYDEGKSYVDVAVEYLQDKGATEYSGGSQGWYSNPDAEQDMHSGDYTSYSYHLKGFTPEEEIEIYRRMTRRGNSAF